MKKFISNSVIKFYSRAQVIISGALVFGLFQFPFLPNIQPSNLLKKDAAQAESLLKESEPFELTGLFFGPEVKENVANQIVLDKMAYVSSRNAYPASLAVIKKHANTIKTFAREKGVPEDVALGVSLLENGGSETAVSSAGALGVFQLMPGTARSLGLTVNKKMDERKDPKKNIEAGITYLKTNHERFGDWGLATWAYHAGEGNVSKAVKLYAQATHKITLKGAKDPKSMREYIEKYNVTIHKLLSSPAVKTLTKKLNDDSEGYPYKVLATASLFREAQHQSAVSSGDVLSNR